MGFFFFTSHQKNTSLRSSGNNLSDLSYFAVLKTFLTKSLFKIHIAYIENFSGCTHELQEIFSFVCIRYEIGDVWLCYTGHYALSYVAHTSADYVAHD